MSNITITIDANHLLRNQEATVQVEQLSDYLHVCLLLRDAFFTGKRVSIVVHQPTVAVWLSRLAMAYGDERITLRHYTPRDALIERWRLTIPSSVSDEGIWDIFHKVHIATEDVILTQEDVSFFLPQIEYYLTAVSRHVANTNDVNVLLEQMSVYL